MAEEDWKPLVLDIGTGTVKAGYAGDDAPTATFPSIVGRHYHAQHAQQRAFGIIMHNRDDGVYVGDEAESRRGVLDLSHPLERGIVTDWDDMERILYHTFNKQLRIMNHEEHPVLCTEVPLLPKENRMKMTEIMFETYNFPAFFVAIPGVLSLYATGSTTGIVLDSGEGVSYAVPVHEGVVISDAVRQLELAGSDMTNILVEHVDEKYPFFTANAKRQIIRDMKEKLGYVALDYDKEIIRARKKTRSIERSYELPDGQVMTIDAERFKCAEVLFQPSLISMQGPGVHKLLFDSLLKCVDHEDDDQCNIRETLCSNIVLTGGSTLLPGFSDRFTKEITQLVPTDVKVNVVAPPERRYTAWIGGSVMASVTTFQEMWISRADYDENGPSIGYKKCPWIDSSTL